MSNSRKRKAQDDDDAPAKKKPKLDSVYTRTDPVTGNLGRIRKKDDKYWSDFTRRARKRKAAREARRKKEEKDEEKKKKQRLQKRKEREERKKKAAEPVSSSESESSSDEDIDEVKREDQSKFVPFFHLTKRFKDHVCVVTGGGRGIGQACALRLAQEGGIVYILDKTRWKETVDQITECQKKLHNKSYRDAMAKFHAANDKNAKNKNKNKVKVKKPRKIRFKERVFQKKCDVADPKQVNAAIAEIVKERGYIDVVLNAVNTTGKDYGDTDSHSVKYESFDKIMKYNLYSTVNVCNAVIPFMIKESYGRIVNLASADGKNGKPKCLAYAAAKSAVINVTKTLGQEYAGTGITVNCIAPQYDEYHTAKLGKKAFERASTVPMGRSIDMEELAGTVAFIASEENTYTTGFCYDLSGGTSTY